MQQNRVDHYRWFCGYLESRDVARVVRVFVATTALAMAAAVLVLLLSPGGPQVRSGQFMMWLAAGGGAVGAAQWVHRWPSRAQSIGFVALTTVSIAVACTAYPDPLAALLGCIAFTTIGAYTAFFHSRSVVIGTLTVAIATALGQAVDIAVDGRIGLAVVDLFLLLQVNIVVVVAIHSLMRTLKADLDHADVDPLTGLLNRRAFRQQVLGLLAPDLNRDEGYLVVALLDLDRFKSLNDTYGHSFGDQALVAVADALRSTATPTTVVARSGGEEFLIADMAASDKAVLRFQTVCEAIAELHIPVTASLGTACVAVTSLRDQSHDAIITELIEVADMAMYHAKSNGGNQCHHHLPGPEHSRCRSINPRQN